MADDDRPLASRTEAPAAVHIRTFLIADMRGYTLFTQERGDEAAGKLAAKFANIAREGVEARGGTLLELRGDEALCVFASAREAIRAAVDLQERFVEATLEQPELPLTVGIGLDAGEAVPVQGGYRGGALNLAARLCGQARAGEILATREVAHLARRIEGARYTDRGSLTFKGISDPVVVVRVVPEGADPIERLRPFTPAPPVPPKMSGRWVIPVGVAAVLALVAVSIPLLGSDDSDAVVAGTNSIARMNAEDGSLELASELGQRPGASAIGFGSLWVVQPDRSRVTRLDLENGSIIDTIPVGASPTGIAVGEGSVWVTNAGDGTVSRIDPDSNEVSDTSPRIGSRPAGIAVGDGALWVADALGAELLRVDPLSHETQPVRLDGQPSGVAFTPEGVWVSFAPDGVARVDPGDLSVTLTQDVGNGPKAVLAAFGSIWVANHLDNTVSRLQPATGTEQAKVQVGEGPNALSAAGGSVWVANEFDSSITSIDPSTNSGVPVPVGGAAASLAAGGGDDLWLAVGVSATEHRGGTLTVSSAAEMPGSLDPARVVFNDTTEGQTLSITNDGLLSFKKVGGADGATVVPDLASALPEVSADGLTYRFPLREGIRYSNGDPVRPEDFRRAVERTIALWPVDEELGPDVAELYGAIKGTRACQKDPATCDLSDAIVTDAEAVTFHLARPDPDLQVKLAMPWAYPVPVATPAEDQGLDPLPATGPYMIAEAGADGVELVRNREFHEWSGAAQPDGLVEAIAWRFDEAPAKAFDRLSAGDLDWMTTPSPADLESLEAAHPEQVVPWPNAATIYFGLNNRIPPFNDERVRQAVNYAIDRNHVVELQGGPTSFRATCQILPPNLQGYEPFCPYTLEPRSGIWSAPDLDRARALIEDADAVGQRVTAWVTDDPDFPPEAVRLEGYIVKVLNELGLQATRKIVQTLKDYNGAVNSGKAQAYMIGWASAYPSAYDFIAPQFSCGGFANVSGYCSRSLDAAIGDAQALQATDPAAANSAWIEIEHQLVEDAIWVPLANPVSSDAFSARTQNIQVHPAWGVLMSRVWVR
jgi:peptide/nickel transport system substrate-binding protein